MVESIKVHRQVLSYRGRQQDRLRDEQTRLRAEKKTRTMMRKRRRRRKRRTRTSKKRVDEGFVGWGN